MIPDVVFVAQRNSQLIMLYLNVLQLCKLGLYQKLGGFPGYARIFSYNISLIFIFIF